MNLLLLFLVFIPSSIAASDNRAEEFERICSEACSFLKSIDKNPKAKINFEKLAEKCKTENKAPQYLCGSFLTPSRISREMMEKDTWADFCKGACYM